MNQNYRQFIYLNSNKISHTRGIFHIQSPYIFCENSSDQPGFIVSIRRGRPLPNT